MNAAVENPYWMPFTANQQFKSTPRLLNKAEGMFYYDEKDRAILDAAAGLWCCNAGHSRDKISNAVAKQVKELDYSPSFQMGHPTQ